jgi:hypothetical protein
MILSPAIVTEVLLSIVCAIGFNEEKKYICETASKYGYDSCIVDKIFKKHELKFIRNQ